MTRLRLARLGLTCLGLTCLGLTCLGLGLGGAAMTEGAAMAHRPDHPVVKTDERTAWEREWETERAAHKELRRRRPLLRSVGRGLRKRCPNCGAPGTLILDFLRPTPGCPACGECFSHIRTDDFAPWLSILVLGHLLMPAAISVERLWHPPLWLHLLIWIPVAAELIVAFLPRAKGAALGLMWSLGLKGDEHQY